MSINKSERSPDRIRFHYETERRLARRLMDASPEERRLINIVVHEELYRLVPDHPLLTKKRSPEMRTKQVERELRLLHRWLRPDTVFLELGAGDCAVSFAVADRAAKACGLDIHDKIARDDRPRNFQFVLSDGTSVPCRGITLAYSNQMMEHLHPDDAMEQLENIHGSLVYGGVYVCNTPNRLTGPHDVSKGFDEVATGFHLHEYTIRELISIFRRRFRRVTWIPKSNVELSWWVGYAYESVVAVFPKTIRKRIPVTPRVAGYK